MKTENGQVLIEQLCKENFLLGARCSFVWHLRYGTRLDPQGLLAVAVVWSLLSGILTTFQP